MPAIDEMERKIGAVVGMARREKLKRDYEKCRWIHNYLVRNVRYNYDALKQPDNYPDSFEIRGVFKDNLAVCEGVSKAFKVLCDRFGVDTLIAFGTSLLKGFGSGNACMEYCPAGRGVQPYRCNLGYGYECGRQVYTVRLFLPA